MEIADGSIADLDLALPLFGLGNDTPNSATPPPSPVRFHRGWWRSNDRNFARKAAHAVVAAVQARCAAARESSCAHHAAALLRATPSLLGNVACQYRFISALLNGPPVTSPRAPASTCPSKRSHAWSNRLINARVAFRARRLTSQAASLGCSTFCSDWLPRTRSRPRLSTPI